MAFKYKPLFIAVGFLCHLSVQDNNDLVFPRVQVALHGLACQVLAIAGREIGRVVRHLCGQYLGAAIRYWR